MAAFAFGRRPAPTPYLRTREGKALIVGVAAAALLGPAAAIGGPLAAGAIIGVGVLVAAFLWPVVAAGLYIASLPLVGGIERGQFLPLVRPQEVIHAALLGILLLRAFWEAPPRSRLPLPRSATARSMVLLAFFGSVPPLLWFAVRFGQLPLDEALTVVPMWRYVALFLLVRLAVRTQAQVQWLLLITVASGVLLALITVAQVLDLPGVRSSLAMIWPPSSGDRGTSTLDSAIATGDYLAICTAIAAAALAKGYSYRRLLWPVVLLLMAGTLATAQFSAFIALGIVLSVVALVTGRARRALWLAVPTVVIAGVVLWPVLALRFVEFQDGGLPQSWVVRMDNLRTFYLPSLSNFGFVLGVRPQTAVVAPEQWRDTIWLESGYIWLLWVGGVPLLLAFFNFARCLLQAATPPARFRSDPVGVAALALLSWLVAMLLLLVLDPHLTMRGAGDLLFWLAALATLPGTEYVRPAAPTPALAADTPALESTEATA